MNITDQKYQEIVDYISDELPKEERIKLENWIAFSKDHKDAFEKINRKILFTQWSLKSAHVNTNKEFKKFEKRLNSKLHYLAWAVAAASIIIVVGLSIPIFWEQYQVNQDLLASSSTIQHGTKGAKLILSNGKHVEIENQSKEIKEKDGSLIQLDSLIGLEYANSKVKPSKIIYNTLRVPRGNEFNLQLADGTRVWLNADSELRYPVQFSGKERQVHLKGEAYFKVSSNTNKAFVVNSYNQQVRVYGTEFCVNAYNHKEIKTVLVEGLVGLRANTNSKEFKLKPGELALANQETGNLDIRKVNVRPYIAWKDGDFVFENESLENIMLRLERWYNVKIFYMNEECKEYRFSGDMKRYADVRKLLFFIQKTSNAKFEINKNTIMVMAK